MNRILIIDGNNLFMRNYIANPTLSSNGAPIGGYIGFLLQLQSILKMTLPDQVHVTWDGRSSSNKKRTIIKNYKEKRKAIKVNRFVDNLSERENDLNSVWQMTELSKLLSEMPVYQHVFNTAEADDIIAALLHELPEDSLKIIVSSDKDFFQLLKEDVLIYKIHSKKFYSKLDLIEEYNIHPNNFALAKALSGDKSDNIDGIKGVGFKNLVSKFKGFDKEKFITIDKLIKMSKENRKEKDLKIFNRIIEGEQTIKDNYKVIQLYNPISDHRIFSKLRKDISEPINYFSAFNIKKELLIHGLGSYDIEFLLRHFRKIKGKKI